MPNFCTKCGASLPEGNAFCTACGTSAAIIDAPPAASTESPRIGPQRCGWQYRVVALQRDLKVINKAFRTRPANEDILAAYLQSIISQNTAQGWEFYRIDTVNMVESPGCLGSLFGIKETTTTYNLVTFRMASDA